MNDARLQDVIARSEREAYALDITSSGARAKSFGPFEGSNRWKSGSGRK